MTADMAVYLGLAVDYVYSRWSTTITSVDTDADVHEQLHWKEYGKQPETLA